MKDDFNEVLDKDGNFPSFGLAPGEEVRVTKGERFRTVPLKSVVVSEAGHIVILRHYFCGPYGHPYDYTTAVSKASLYCGDSEIIRKAAGKRVGRCSYAAD